MTPGLRWLLTLVLLAAAVATGWSVLTHRAPDRVRDPASGRSDYQLYDFEVVVLDELGVESFTLRAPHLARQPADESMELDAPVFMFPAGDEATGESRWEMRSREGWVSPEGDEVRLTGAVEVEGSDDDGTPTLLRTERLEVFPRDDRASTDLPVRIDRASSILRGRGMQVDLATKHYVLLSDVETRYVPNR